MNYLLVDCDESMLGMAVQQIAEVSKTIGDAYLLQRARLAHAREVVKRIKDVFSARQLDFQENVKVKGTLESYPFDVLVKPNGRPGLAVAVIGGHSTHSLAKVWAFNCIDIRDAHAQRKHNVLKLGIVLDEQDSAPWTKGSVKILRKGADIVASSRDLSDLEHGMLMQGVVA